MKFLLWYSAIVVSLSAILCLFASEDTYEFIGGLIYVPVVVYLWKQILAENRKEVK